MELIVKTRNPIGNDWTVVVCEIPSGVRPEALLGWKQEGERAGSITCESAAVWRPLRWAAVSSRTLRRPKIRGGTNPADHIQHPPGV